MKVLILFYLVAYFQVSAWAHIQLHGQPLFTEATSVIFEIATWTSTKPTVCFITNDEISQCRRRRGIQEEPEIIKFRGGFGIAPSAILRVEPTPAPPALRQFLSAGRIFSSFDDPFSGSTHFFRRLQARDRNDVITVGDCGMSTVNLSQFLACLGMTVQETTTLTATFTQTSILSRGYTTMTVAGCTPAGFPYIYCPLVMNVTSSAESQSEILPSRIAPVKQLHNESEPEESETKENRVESKIYTLKMT